MNSGLYNLRILHKNLKNRLRKQKDNSDKNQREHQLNLKIKTKKRTKSLLISRPITKAQSRLRSKGKAYQNQHADHVNLHRDSKCGNLIRSVADKTPVGQKNRKRLHQICGRCRNPDGQNIAEHRSLNSAVLNPDGQYLRFSFHGNQKENIRNHIAEYGSKRCSGRPHSKSENENRIQYNIDDSSCDGADHRVL